MGMWLIGSRDFGLWVSAEYGDGDVEDVYHNGRGQV
jgi:hypothetical protein